MTKKALYTGSFDPMTNGHLDIITRASKMFDELVVGVIVNPNKNPLFTREERVAMIKEVTAQLDNVRVDSFEGLLADYVNKNQFDAVVRGLRATSDFEYEIQMAQMNACLFDKGIDDKSEVFFYQFQHDKGSSFAEWMCRRIGSGNYFEKDKRKIQQVIRRII